MTTFLYQIAIIAHFVGLSLILGGFVMQLGRKEGFRFGIILAGAITQLLSGVLLVGVAEMSGFDVNNAKIAVKGVVVVIALVAAIVGLLRQRKVDSGAIDRPKAALPFLHIAGAGAVANLLIAVLWR